MTDDTVDQNGLKNSFQNIYKKTYKKNIKKWRFQNQSAHNKEDYLWKAKVDSDSP